MKHLDTLLFDETEEAPAEVRKRLEAEGIDVKGLVARVKAVAGEAYREHLTAEAQHARSTRAQAKGKVFGNLVGLGREKLLELIRAAASGQYGQAAMARCRNQDTAGLSDEDLRTLIEDIESTMEQ
ncbi:MAG: hypothetical protein IT578_12040 [Verrucomicrobiae bacterium]|nr:hypothetical protein [Verrucomicrobiae bacterium]